MDFDHLSLGIFDLVGVIMLVLAGTSFIYLLRVKGKTSSTRMLVWFFLCVVLSAIATIVTNIGTAWDWAFAPAQDALLILGGVFLVRFAYSYPTEDQPRESRWVVTFIVLLALAALTYAVSFAIRSFANLPGDLDENQAFYLLTPVTISLTVFVFLRRSNHCSAQIAGSNKTETQAWRSSIKSLLKPKHRSALALRNYGLSLAISLVPAVALIEKTALPAVVASILFNFGAVIAISALMLTYLNFAPESVTISAKLVGISLVSVLLILGLAGEWIYHANPGINQQSIISNFILLVLLSTLLIVLIFPLFFRTALLDPLAKLLRGVKTANEGDLSVQVAVQYEDEIGSLTHSFNNLVTSLRESSQARDAVETELKQRLGELRLSEEKFYKAFHSSPAAMVLQNQQDRRYLDVNAVFTQVTGYPREEAVGRTPGELDLYPDQDEARRVAEAFVATQGRLRNFEFRFKRSDRQVGTGLLSSEIFELQGVRTMLGIVMDITERKRAEEKIHLLNVEMERRVAERSWQLSTLLDLAFLVSHQEHPEGVFTPALERLMDISGLQAVCIHICSNDKQVLRLEEQVGLETDEADRMHLLLPSGLFAAWLSRPKDALIFSGLEGNTILPDVLRPGRLRSCLLTQLVAQGEVLGLMSCYRQDVHTFSLEEVSLLVAVAEQLGISLENQRLRQEAEQTAITTERQRLARDLHDAITQSIYGLMLFARSSQDALRERNEEKLAASLDQIEENARIALKEMRLLLFQMQPQGLEGGFSQGITARLDLVERRLGIQAACDIDENIPLPPDIEAALYRIAMEALNNSLKHAQAKHVHISLESVNGGLVMEVRDDGQGFDYAAQPDTAGFSGMGLKNMRARAIELGADLEIITSPGNGTRVRLACDLIADRAERSIE